MTTLLTSQATTLQGARTATGDNPDLPPRLTGGRKVWASKWFTPFHRILLLAVAANVVVAIFLLSSRSSWDSVLTATITAATINIGIAALMRQQNVVNGMFAAALSVPRTWPLRLRAATAQVYQLPGGFHVGCAISATSWFAVYASMVFLTPPSTAGLAQHIALLSIVGAILADLLLMSVCARPSMRERHHDLFEATHRYGGWASLVLFAALTVVHAAAGPGPAGHAILISPNTWVIAGLIIIAVLPWLQLRKVPVTVNNPSDHVALVTVDRGRVLSGSATRIARHPLGQWHSFATITVPDKDGFRLAISRAGGWTGQFISDRPDHLWTRGVPTAGMVSVSRVFNRVVWLTTGSGIAPCLPQLLEQQTPAHLLWVTRNPAKTYGDDLVGEILAANPDATLWNTDELGKPDLVELAHRSYRDTGAEAVMVVSNKPTTVRVVAELRSRGIPAFGPIWDS